MKVGVLFRDETAWLTQKALAELFGVGVPAINKHLKNIFDSGELEPEATVSRMEMVRNEGGREVARAVEFYSLDANIAVGYRVNSHQATQLRIWATKTLREFMIKGFVLDDGVVRGDERARYAIPSASRSTVTSNRSAGSRRASACSISARSSSSFFRGAPFRFAASRGVRPPRARICSSSQRWYCSA